MSPGNSSVLLNMLPGGIFRGTDEEDIEGLCPPPWCALVPAAGPTPHYSTCAHLPQNLDNAVEGDAKYMARELMCRQFSEAADIFRSASLSPFLSLSLSCTITRTNATHFFDGQSEQFFFHTYLESRGTLRYICAVPVCMYNILFTKFLHSDD